MDKREFLKTSGILLAGSMLPRFASGEPNAEDAASQAVIGANPRTNWSGNLTYHARSLDLPSGIEELQREIKGGGPVKALGARHSFNTIADTTGDQISLQHFDQMSLDENTHTVTVGGGVRYGQLAPWLDAKGYALHNLASLPHVTVAGACATATHGSGNHNGNLSTAVAGLEMVTGTGEVVHLSAEKDGDRFHGVVVGLGALGIATRVTLRMQTRFLMSQVVYQNMPFSVLEHHLDEIFASGYSVSLFTDWQNHRATQVWIKSRLTGDTPLHSAPEFHGATLAKQNLHPVTGHSAESCTEQMGVPGPWYERMPHFKMNFTPSSGQELQTEYFVPRERGYEAILAVEKLRDEITPHLFVSELRTIDADNLWMSPCYHRPSMTLHFTWKPEWPAVKQILPKIEAALAPFAFRPHWAKMFTVAPATIHAQYERLADFRNLVKEYDPQRRFANDFLRTNLYA
ncbi:FAD-binding protein [Paracidobacterium acidisoli]|uniref:FAD-binding protein n=1 Tax=Paracidobacterium acidisoli TaxID=2303751 RepID=A0A372IQM9_9BACT|nr:FAD-binding protein [Paracidobacterium acidisoli]MBT9331218.1 FAD-binding protein [Paracidobacterium acidisoli]